jgi:vacuolar-type H+-ATPase subunit I/STV1
MTNNKKTKVAPSTQQYVDIAEIRDDLVVMKDGTTRAVLMVSSINFALKSTEEQEAIIQAYITFLNGLEYPIQIVVQSRRMNIDEYLARLREQERKTQNELLKAQITDYRDFVTELVEMGDIMQKRFFVVLPYDPLSNKRRGFWSRLSQAVSPIASAKLNKKQWEDRKEQMNRRAELITVQLEGMGLSVARLDTQGLIELYYDVYNPDVFGRQPLQDLEKIHHDE